MENTTHFILQGKGGVGKSLIASMLAQYLLAKGFDPACADTDPVNTTFAQIKGLKVSKVPIAENGSVVQRLFDPLFIQILEVSTPCVIDNGASTFLPILKYIKSNEVFDVLRQHGKQVYVHAVIVGGQAKDETAQGLMTLIEMVKKTGAKVVVWQNEFWGIPMFNGEGLDQRPWVKDNQDCVAGIVKIIDRNDDATATDIRIMTEKHMTLNEVQDSEDFGLFAKSRISRVFRSVFEELDAVFPSVKNCQLPATSANAVGGGL